MLNIELMVIGKLSQQFLKDGCEEYVKRIAPLAKLTVTELSEKKPNGDSPAAVQKAIESESAQQLERIAARKGLRVAMCVEGKQFSSPELAEKLEQAAVLDSHITFVIGGASGMSEELKKSCDLRLSISKMTFTHQFARLLLLEQIYRALTINANIKYHK